MILQIWSHPEAFYKLIQAAVADVGSHDLQWALLQSHELATFFEEVEAGPEAEFLGTLIFDDFWWFVDDFTVDFNQTILRYNYLILFEDFFQFPSSPGCQVSSLDIPTSNFLVYKSLQNALTLQHCRFAIFECLCDTVHKQVP